MCGVSGIAIPIYWQDQQKKGTSSIEERKQLFGKAMKHYNFQGKILIADRDGVARRYIGEEWFSFLKKPAASVVRFKHLKSNGFKLEEINLDGENRSRLMMAVVVIVYTLSVCEGLKDYKKVPVNKYKIGLQTKACSVFRLGLDKPASFCFNMETFLAYLIDSLVTKLPVFRSKQAIIV